MLALVLMAACATAAKDAPGGGNPDAGKGDDPNPTPDAALIDAPMMMLDGPSGSVCASAQTCAGAQMLGNVSGDDLREPVRAPARSGRCGHDPLRRGRAARGRRLLPLIHLQPVARTAFGSVGYLLKA